VAALAPVHCEPAQGLDSVSHCTFGPSAIGRLTVVGDMAAPEAPDIPDGPHCTDAITREFFNHAILHAQMTTSATYQESALVR
jgi:hypothetical protein